MSIDTNVNVTRAGSPVGSSAIPVQLDLMSQQQALAYGGASNGEAPYFRFKGFTEAYITLLQGDLLTDTVKNDPTTGAHTRYRIISDVEPFDDGHSRFVCDRMIGT